MHVGTKRLAVSVGRKPGMVARYGQRVCGQKQLEVQDLSARQARPDGAALEVRLS
jgi:hypothetical protein